MTSPSKSEQIKIGIAIARENGADWGSAGKERARLNKEAADIFASSLRPLIAEIALISTRPERLAYYLNVMEVPTARGGRWSRVTVRRLLHRLGGIESCQVLSKALILHNGNIRQTTYEQWLALRSKET